MIDPLTLITFFGPLVKDVGQGITKKLLGDKAAKPANVGEVVQLMEAETKQLEARAKIGDTEGETYPWVIAAVKLQRPIIVYLTLLCFLLMSVFGLGDQQSRDTVGQLSAIVIMWLFGERSLLKLKGV